MSPTSYQAAPPRVSGRTIAIEPRPHNIKASRAPGRRGSLASSAFTSARIGAQSNYPPNGKHPAQ